MKRDHEDYSQQQHEGQQPEKKVKTNRIMPKKADYRMRAHINPLNSTNFPYPSHHTFVDWAKHYPAKFNKTKEQNYQITCNTVEHPSLYDKQRQYQVKQDQRVTMIDIGCGFGGLLFGLAPHFQDKLIMGLQIRDKLVNFVAEKIRGHRMTQGNSYDNISVVRTNTMRHLCQYFPKQSLQKIFICFPDPHFKAKNYRRRIINTGYLSEYAYLLKQGGRLYCITDVLELHEWHLDHLRAHKMFVEDKNSEQDICVKVMINKTQQGQKVQRNAGSKYWAVFTKVTPKNL